MTQPTTTRSSGPTTGVRGAAIDFARGTTSKERLKVDWLHPVPPERDAVGTAASGAMPLNAALEVLWGEGDDRPLLVLRECTSCVGSDDALLSRATSNDRTMLLTKWFRAVRLPPHVMQPSHPFFNVFGGQGFKEVPHLFLLAGPGQTPVLFNGTQTPNELKKGLCEVIEQRYAKDPQKAVKAWLSLLDSFDTLDARRRATEEKLAEVRATDGPESSRAKKLMAELEQTKADRQLALQREEKVRDLGLLPMSRAAFAGLVGAAR